MVQCTTVIPGITGILDRQRSGFIDAFKEVFAGKPYEETYSDEDVVEDIWLPHLRDGMIIVAEEAGKVVGFGCALPLAKAPAEVQEFVHSSKQEGLLPGDFNTDKAWYMSELGVLESFRQKQVGYDLVRHRLMSISHGGGKHYIMRTAQVASMSRHLYEQVGAEELDAVQDVSDTKQVSVNGSHSTSRVYLYGGCAHAIELINERMRTAQPSTAS